MSTNTFPYWKLAPNAFNAFNKFTETLETGSIDVKSRMIMNIRKESIGFFFPPCLQCLNRTEMTECTLRDLSII